MIRTYGPVQINIDINGQKTELSAYLLPNLQDHILLGIEWLEAEHAMIDIRRQCLYFGSLRRHSVFWENPLNHRNYNDPGELTEEHVPSQYKERIQAVLQTFAEVFCDRPSQTTTKLVQHSIKLKDTTPVRVRRYKYSLEKKRVIQEEVEKMLAARVIRRSHSSFNSPIVIVEKKDKAPRFCVDYRQLNQQTVDEVTQLPHIPETLQELGTATIFTSLDLKSGYWQVPMEEASIPYTAFSTPDGATYEFLVMPFGLKNAPSTFQKMMAEVLGGYIDRFVKVYLDDIIIYSNNIQEHENHLKLVLERLTTHGLTCSLKKCKFAVESIEYLGHTVKTTYNQAQERHQFNIQEFPTPRTMKQLQSFLGTANWLRDYVPGFAQESAPLTDVLGKKKFLWTPEADAAFHRVKELLGQPLILHRPDPERPMVLQTDASTRGMGAVLYQLDNQGEKRIIACASAKFNTTERNYHCNEQEVLAVVWACKRYRALLEDRPFTLVTDSRALQWLQQYRDLKAKLTRWALLLQEFNFTVQHCPGKRNQLADFLSRHPDNEGQGTENIDEGRLLPPTIHNIKPCRAATARANSRRIPPVLLNRIEDQDDENEPRLPLYEEIVQAQRRSVEYQATRARWHRLRQGEEVTRLPWQRALRDDYQVIDDLLWYTRDGCQALVVPLNYWPRVIYEYHDSPEAGHPGRDESIRAVSRLYYWPAMKKQIKNHVRQCMICAACKRGGALQPAAPQRPHVPVRPWQAVSLDVMGPFTGSRRKNRFLLVCTDIFTKWVEAKPVPSANATAITKFLHEVCTRWGYMEVTITDNGPAFRSRTWERFHRRNFMETYFVPIYHQRANPVERRNQELKKLLRIQKREQPDNRWDENIQELLYTLRNRKNAATGMSPSEALLGAPMARPGEWTHPEVHQRVHNDARARDERLQRIRRQQTEFNRQFPEAEAPVHFNVGDQVLCRNFPGTRREFDATWTGPHPVIAVLGETVYEIDRNGSQYRVHLDDLRPAPQPELPQADVDDEPFTRPLSPNEAIINVDFPNIPSRPEEEGEVPPRHDDLHTSIPGVTAHLRCSRTQVPGSRRHGPSEAQPRADPRPPSPPAWQGAKLANRFRKARPAQSKEPENLTKVGSCPTGLVSIEDWPDDPGDPGEARPTWGLIPITGLYP